MKILTLKSIYQPTTQLSQKCAFHTHHKISSKILLIYFSAQQCQDYKKNHPQYVTFAILKSPNSREKGTVWAKQNYFSIKSSTENQYLIMQVSIKGNCCQHNIEIFIFMSLALDCERCSFIFIANKNIYIFFGSFWCCCC